MHMQRSSLSLLVLLFCASSGAISALEDAERPLTTEEAGWADPVGREPWRVLEDSEAPGGTSGGVFNIPAFFILLRETLEFTIVLAVIFQYLKRVELTHLSKYVWMGAGAGILASIVIGVVFILLFYLAKNAAISGGGQNLLESILRLVACAVITALAFGMTKIMNMSGKFRAKLEKLTRQIGNEPKTHWGLLCFAFTCVLREGIESVLFLAGVSSGFSAVSMVLPSVIGVVSGLIIGLIFFRSANELNMKVLAGVSTALLLLVAAGLCSNSFYGLQEAGAFPGASDAAVFELGSTSNAFWFLMSALFGYHEAPTSVIIGTYLGYWALVLLAMWYKGFFRCKDSSKSKTQWTQQEVESMDEESAEAKHDEKAGDSRDTTCIAGVTALQA